MINVSKFSPVLKQFRTRTTTISPHLSASSHDSPLSPIKECTMPFWIHLRSIKKLRLLRKIMAQAAVDLANLPSSHRRTSHASRKRKYTDEESTLDEDPAWQPSDIKPKRKRRSRADQAENNHHHSPQSPVHQSLHSRVSPPMGISVELTKTSDDMWENFRKIGTEMIICKEGRSEK